MSKNQKIIYWSLLILCGGFFILEYFQGSKTNALIWIVAFCLVTIAGTLYQRKKKAPASEKLTSILEEETKEKIRSHQNVEFAIPGIRFQSSEVCRWYDRAACDYYQAKTGMMYLTNRRLIFHSDSFSFAHPLSQISITPTRNGFEVSIHNKKMKFVSASTEEFFTVWNEIRK